MASPLILPRTISWLAGQVHIGDLAVLPAQRFDIASGFDQQGIAPDFIGSLQGQTPRQRHDLVPALGRFSRVDVENDVDAALAVRRCRWGMDAARLGGAEVEIMVRGDDKLVALGVIVAQEGLTSAHVAVEEEDVAVADWPEIGAGAVVADEREAVIFHKRVQIVPVDQVRRAEEEVGARASAGCCVGQGTAGKGVVVVPFLPDAGIEDPVGQGRAVGAGLGNDRRAGELFPVEQQRIVRDGHHVAHLGAVIHGNNSIVFDQRRARIAAFLRIGVDGIGKVLPVDEIIADGVAPVLTRVFGRAGLVEEMPAVLPETESVWIVQGVFRVDIVVYRPVGIAFIAFAIGEQPLHQGIGLQRGLLLGQGFGKAILGNEGGVIGSFGGAHG